MLAQQSGRTQGRLLPKLLLHHSQIKDVSPPPHVPVCAFFKLCVLFKLLKGFFSPAAFESFRLLICLKKLVV